MSILKRAFKFKAFDKEIRLVDGPSMSFNSDDKRITQFTPTTNSQNMFIGGCLGRSDLFAFRKNIGRVAQDPPGN